LLELPIPDICVEVSKPGTKCGQICGREIKHGLLDFLNGAHGNSLLLLMVWRNGFVSGALLAGG